VRRLTHHVKGSLFPNWAGENQIRVYQFVEGRLSLTTPPFVGKRAQLTLTLLWEREAERLAHHVPGNIAPTPARL